MEESITIKYVYIPDEEFDLGIVKSTPPELDNNETSDSLGVEITDELIWDNSYVEEVEDYGNVCGCMKLKDKERWLHTGYCRCNKCASLLLLPCDNDIVSVLHVHDYGRKDKLICKTCPAADTHEPQSQMLYCNICKQLVSRRAMAHACKPGTMNNSPVYESVKIYNTEGIDKKICKAVLKIRNMNLAPFKCNVCNILFATDSFLNFHSCVITGRGSVTSHQHKEITKGSYKCQYCKVQSNECTHFENNSIDRQIRDDTKHGREEGSSYNVCDIKLEALNKLPEDLSEVKKFNVFLMDNFMKAKKTWLDEKEQLQKEIFELKKSQTVTNDELLCGSSETESAGELEDGEVCSCLMLTDEERWLHTGYCRCNTCSSLLPSDTDIVSVLFDHDYGRKSELICKTCQTSDPYGSHSEMLYCNICKQLVSRRAMAHACKPHAGIDNSPVYESVKINNSKGIDMKISKPVLKIHYINIAQFKCDLCNKLFLNIHSCANTPRKGLYKCRRYKCKHCKKSFVLLTNVRAHAPMRNEKRLLYCKVCYKSLIVYKSVAQLQKRGPFWEKKFACKFCKKRYFYKFRLESHERQHTEKNIQM